jgi:YD repeat-containing protein
MAAGVFAPSVGLAQTAITFQYSYDATGQLIRASDSTGVVIEYIYDAVGNMVEVRRSNVNPTQLTILGFSPSQGGRGTLVTIEGMGFSNQAGSNVVSFNGVPARVSSATANTVVAQVPAGASTGPVSVTVGSSTAISPVPFTVLAVPFVTSIAPRAFDATKPPSSIQMTGSDLTGSQFALLPAFAPPPVVLGTPQIDPTGTVATLPLTVAPNARGTFVVVATNTFGSSDAFPNAGNTLVIVNAQEEVDSDADGFPDGLELLSGSNPFDAASVPTLTEVGDVLSPAFATVNKLLSLAVPRNQESEADRDDDGFPEGLELLFGANPFETASVPTLTELGMVVSAAFATVNKLVSLAVPRNLESEADRDSDGFPEGLELTFGSNPFEMASVPTLSDLGTVLSPAVSLVNTTPPPGTSQNVLSSAVSVLNSPSSPLTTAQQTANTSGAGSTGVTLQVDRPRSGGRLIEGQTVTISAVVTGVVNSVQFAVNGVPFALDSTFPYELLFTVPSGVGNVTFAASAPDIGGTSVNSEPVTMQIDPDLLTTVSGRVVDAAGIPVQGALVELLSEGLQAEFFEFAGPLSALPDLAGANPDRTTRVTALNMRSPNGVFAGDPFGVQLAPDYAARFTGWINVSVAGAHTFFLGADEGARLKVSGVTVVDVPTGKGEYQEASGTVNLSTGLIPIEVTFYESAGNVELQLSWAPPGGERQVVAPVSFVPNTQIFSAITDQSGRLTLIAVPTALEGIQIRATVIEPAGNTEAYSNRYTPVPTGAVDVGDVVVQRP